MRRFICQLSCCLLALALVADRPAFAAGASDKDSKSAAESKWDERSKGGEKAKGDEKAKAVAEAKKPPASKPATHAVKKEPLKIEATLSGVFEAQKMTEISLKTEAWTMLSVVSAVEHGTHVSRGDLLVYLIQFFLKDWLN